VKDKILDDLTGLETHARIATVRRGSAIAFVDLRDFRERVNVPYGHEMGDRAIRAVAERLRDGLAPFRVFRFGGDEFLIEIDQPLDSGGAADLAGRIADLVGQPIDGIAEPLEAWVGITLRRVVDDVMEVGMEAATAAQVTAPSAGLPFAIVSERT
jgi:diguanylate cyclase (GGDEF)-like protein